MNFLKKLLIVILYLFLINLIGIFAISCNLKDTLVNGLIKTIVQENIKNTEENFIIEKNDILKDIDNSKIKEILDSKESQDLLEKYMNITIEGITDDKKLDEIKIEEDVLEYLKKNKEELSNILGEDITEEMINQAKENFDSKESSKILKEALQDTQKNLTKQEKIVLNCYKVLISQVFKFIIIMLIGLDLVLLALLQKSFHKWINSLGIAMIISGILLVTISLIIKEIITSVSGLEGFNINNLQITSIGILIAGIVIVVIYNVVTKLIMKEKTQ